jgi:protein TonB
MRFKYLAAFALLILLSSVSLPALGDKKYPGEDDFVMVDKPAQIKTQIDPVYPDSARINGIEGVVWVKALIDENGKVIDAKVIKCSRQNCGFEQAALEAAKKCEYLPATQNEKPVSVWIAYKVEFALVEKPE